MNWLISNLRSVRPDCFGGKAVEMQPDRPAALAFGHDNVAVGEPQAEGCGAFQEIVEVGLRPHTPGVFAFVHPCGIVPWYAVLPMHEGPYLVMHYLCQFMDEHRHPSGGYRLRSFGYDNNCNVEASIRKCMRQKSSQDLGTHERVTLQDLRGLSLFIDAYHVEKHKRLHCRTALHPSEENKKWREKINTQAVEQLWCQLNRHKAKLRHMSPILFEFTLLVILHVRNSYSIRQKFCPDVADEDLSSSSGSSD